MKKILVVVKIYIFFTQIHRFISKKIYTFVKTPLIKIYKTKITIIQNKPCSC
ncbi:hypothetical protein CLV73_0678 [Chryseobacterium geocarposphaerae]|uniref:Uncharacterized protein n=1 Tax=Chryseobacterium geocarposphaerae TaxID=1416776 RepID=A0A2M9C770_9FLAO|nr:hypothetical protein CLV73_0678 [Chryseobacterium geocarposphaerae]